MFPRSGERGYDCRLRWQLLSLLLILPLAGVVAGSTEGDEELLKRHGIGADAASIRQFLESLHPGGELHKRVEGLLVQLGSDDFVRRQSAMLQLLQIPTLPIETVQAAAEGNDAEIRWRAQLVLEYAGRKSEPLLRAALRVIEDRKLPGLAEPILAAAPFYENAALQLMAQRALLKSATTEDIPLLRDSLTDSHKITRVLAVQALAEVLGPASADDVRPLYQDASEQVRLAAALGLANHADRTAVVELSRLLDASELQVRARSVQALRALTGKRFQFVAYDKLQSRTEAAAAWQAWVQGAGQTAELRVPIALGTVTLGRTLVCCYDTARVVEYDHEGNVVWELATPQPWSGQGLANGHRLIASFESNSVREYDAQGSLFWEVTGLAGNPSSAQRLENGNTVISLASAGKVVEIAPDKSIVKELQITGRPSFAQRLESGNTLVALQTGSRVVELGPGGKVVWTLPDVNNPFSARRLDNGNTLVAQPQSNTVAEFDPKKKMVWSKSGVSNPYDAFRLDNGHTLIASASGIEEVDEHGKAVWSKTGLGNVLRVCPY